MSNGSDDWVLTMDEACASHEAGMYREALPKYHSALASLGTFADEKTLLTVYMRIIACHYRLREVSHAYLNRVLLLFLILACLQHASVLRLCDEVEPIITRVEGSESTQMALLLRRRAEGLSHVGQLRKARVAAQKSIEICKGARGEEYVDGLILLSDILYRRGKVEEGLQYIVEARSVLPSGDSFTFANVLNSQAGFLSELHRYEEALPVRQQSQALYLRLYGSDHLQYATGCMNLATLYMSLKQLDEALEAFKKCRAIRVKTLGPLHQSTQDVEFLIASCQKIRTQPEMKKQWGPTKERLCNIDGCNSIEKSMERCMSCLSHYLCKKHKGKINEHIVTCPKFADVLPEDKKVEKIVKCRRCRKQTKLMKCAVCEKVKYCSATCQKEDWKRHKLFCGKK